AAGAKDAAIGLPKDIFAALSEIEIVEVDEDVAVHCNVGDLGRDEGVVCRDIEIIVEARLCERERLVAGIFAFGEDRQGRAYVRVAHEIYDVAVDLRQQVVEIIGNERRIAALLVEVGYEGARIE